MISWSRYALACMHPFMDFVVNRCEGLPLALTVVAKSLRGKDPSFWETKLLDWSERRSLLRSDSDVQDCLRKSLYHLDGEIKERFLDLSSFPEDRKIPATALIDMWVELYKLDFSGVRAIADLNKLVYRNLADLVVTGKDSNEDDDKCYSSYYAMHHDLLRELAILECDQGEVEKRKTYFGLDWKQFSQLVEQAKAIDSRCSSSIHLHSQASTSNDAKISNAIPNLVELHIDYCNDLMALPDDIYEIKLLEKLSITNCHNLFALPEQIRQLASLEVVRLNSYTNLSQLSEWRSGKQLLFSGDVASAMVVLRFFS
ncbi:probable disease resistance protein At4g33300 [Eucalyptus grandis]|uniref:probable disease resistance protein At4g33300 n=1 Tax=Eucalyptus grandis TaxID=71139 RepID=UPI00192EE9CA|nr:probable disease resistance protein At4g33300 [Eucalyptus grandis]